MSEKVPRRANFGRGLGHAWILEEVSTKYDTLEPFIQYVKLDDPEMQRAVRFGYYRVVCGKRSRMLASVLLEISMLQDLKRKIEETKAYAIKTALREAFG
jgi:hypothetical protein